MSQEMFSLEGKTALVTGASRGIGAAIAMAYAEAGADVALAARSTHDIEVLAGKIEATGRKAIAITTDVTDAGQIERCVSQTLEALGKIDVLVNNAGGTKFMSPLIDTRPDGWTKAIALNLDNVFHFMQLVGRHMVARGSGSVVNISSVAGISAAPTLSYYSAAKHAVIGLTKTAAVEWGSANVRANSICPGWVKTDLNKNLWGDETLASQWVQDQPLKRWGEVEDITGAALWLASDASRYVTGATIVIDGGQSI
ncbi:MAG TPA: SDR family NAD(P)-dependent oxidoreductase [Actinomycetota bacterium]|nr:SDR family NAD(P)-dependent oxidoreductase [Actinomycetota bacterium]